MTELNDPRRRGHAEAAATAVDYHLEHLDEIRAALINAEHRAIALGRVLDSLAEEGLATPEILAALEDWEGVAGSFGYVPIDIPDFLNLLLDLDSVLTADADYASADLRYRQVSFLEVGCGPGRNVFLAQNSEILLWRGVHGFDIVEPYVRVARQAYGLGEDVWVADAFTFDYGEYDAVFSYRPFSDAERQRDYETHLVASMRPGSYLLAPLNESLDTNRALLAKGSTGQIWKKLA